MTVKELIEELKKFPQDLEAMTYNGRTADQPILEVSLEKGWEKGEDVVFIEGNL
tara:strand:- start:278 stop:439 length:162 start_codon:yes stop_codon:yes gene_type:complete